jgi:oligopeptide/dipeptide ABC transporter ATP-binding protein
MSSLLAVEDLVVTVGRARAVDRVSFALARGEALGLVGESGCGKTLTAKAIMRLLSAPAAIESGSVRFENEELTGAGEKRLCELRGARMAMIFQEPMTALNPVLTAGAQVAEVFRVHRKLSRGQARTAARKMFERVRLADPERALDAYPHELSGGMRQRVLIAMALALEPALLVADEPTTALDVTVQAEILELIGELRRELGTAVLWITHDLAVVARVCERAMVMYAGQIVEAGGVEELFRRPLHPYTAGLLRSLPSARVRGRRLRAIGGVVPELGSYSEGCRFAERCERREERCVREAPVLVDHRVRCFFPGEVER